MVEVVTSSGFSRLSKLVQPRAQQALRSSSICELRDLCVDQQDGVLLLCGTVSSFYHKQLAQEVVRAMCKDNGVELLNSIRVRSAQ